MRIGLGNFYRCKIYGEWKPDENTLDLSAWFYETPRKELFKFKFNKNKTKLTLVFENNHKEEMDFVKGSDLCIPR